MFKKYVAADQYQALKTKYENMGMSMMNELMKPVDLNYGYVAMNTSQKDKEGQENLDMSQECELERHGLTEAGV